MTTNDYDEAVIDIAGIVGNANNLRDRLQRAAGLAQVTIAKAAETDRLTDENRRLRAKVDELEANASDARAELAKRSSEIAKLQFTIDNLRLDLARRQGPEALAEACKSIGTVAVAVTSDYVTRAELVKILRNTSGAFSAAKAIEDGKFAP
jgi:hypothetical protein